MEPGTVRQMPLTPRVPAQRGGGVPGRRGKPPTAGSPRRPSDVAVRAISDQSTPDEPMAVLVVGCHASGKRALIRALLREGSEPVEVSPASYLVMRYGSGGEPLAHVPGHRGPRPYRPDVTGHPVGIRGDDAALARPPRRVELALPDPLLRHFALVESPCARRLGAGGGLVLAEAAERGGAVVFVAAGGRSLTRSELDLLAELATRDVSMFFAAVPAVDDPAVDDPAVDDPDDDDPVSLAPEGHREIVSGHVPALADAPWFTVDPVVGDVAYLRRALVEWAGAEGLRRASDNPPVPAAVGTVHVAETAAASGWSDVLDRWRESSTRLVGQRLAIEVADVHLRCVRDLVFGAGLVALPETLDHELHALSQRATAEFDTVVATIVHDVLRRVLGGEPTEGVRRRVVAAVRRGLTTDAYGVELARVLLVTEAGGVATETGWDALVALAGYAPATVPSILPPVGLAVSGGCYQRWRGPAWRGERAGEPGGPAAAVPAGEGVDQARMWLQVVTRAMELELVRDAERRLEAVRSSLGALIGETIDHGILLA